MILNSYLITCDWTGRSKQLEFNEYSEESRSKYTINPLLVIRMIIFGIIYLCVVCCFFRAFQWLRWGAASVLPFDSFDASSSFWFFLFANRMRCNVHCNKMHLVLDSLLIKLAVVCERPTKKHDAMLQIIMAANHLSLKVHLCLHQLNNATLRFQLV